VPRFARLLLVAVLLAAVLPAAARAQAPAPSAAPAPPAPGSPDANVATNDANKEIVRHYLQILSGGTLDALDQVVGPDFADRTPGVPGNLHGPDTIRDSQRRARELFQDIRYTVDDLIAEGDRVAARYTVRAVRKGNGGSGKPVEVTGITIFRIADGKIRETWVVNDQIELFHQLGFTIQPPKTEPSKPASPP
jgi:ketosteroid isomerase-like protein